MIIDFLKFQNVSCYGLLDVNAVLTPIPTGQYVEVVFLPGFQYVAYRANESSQVQNYIPYFSTILKFLGSHYHSV